MDTIRTNDARARNRLAGASRGRVAPLLNRTAAYRKRMDKLKQRAYCQLDSRPVFVRPWVGLRKGGELDNMRFHGELSQGLVTVRDGGIEARVMLHRIELPLYKGSLPQKAWQKPVVGPPVRPFAELQVVGGLESEGWAAAWVYRPGRFLATWEPRAFASMPAKAMALYESIRAKVGANAGCWDVFAWRKDRCLFAELKRAKTSDRIRKSQLVWRCAALELGVPSRSFAIVEWSGGAFEVSSRLHLSTRASATPIPRTRLPA